MNKQKIAVVMGGPSREHEVSLHTGEAMLNNLDPHKYQAIKVVLSKNHQWFFGDEERGTDTGTALARFQKEDMLVMLALHGSYGEDGTMQALLERYGVAYTGSGLGASILAMDKIASNEIYSDKGLLVPRTMAFSDEDSSVTSQVTEEFELPVIVKPVQQGSSVGVHLVKAPEDLAAAIEDAFTHDQQIMVQDYIKGREVSCGVIQIEDKLTVLPPTELRPIVSEIFDYDAKYLPGGSEEITPADMPGTVLQRIQDIAILVHKALGCRTYSRTDMIVAEGDIYMIETNTLPGMTSTSILPQQAKEAGISFGELLDYIIDDAKRYNKVNG